MKELLEKSLNGVALTKEDCVSLLNIDNKSADFYELLSVANQLSRKEFNNKGYIFAQIGLNAEPCSVNCKFCSLGMDHYALEGTWVKTPQKVVEEVAGFVKDGVDDVFLMTTEDYDPDMFIDIGEKVKAILPAGVRLVANTGDFDLKFAKKLKEVGFTGVYHIRRLNEGIDTGVSPETRIKTLDSIVEAGLDLYYCVEPIGPEHSYEQIVEEMFRAKDYNVDVMAVMRRIAFPSSPLEKYGQISALELAKIAAVARLATRPKRSLNAHETIPCSLLGGVNQLYAEAGSNPRDTKSNTEENRGLSVSEVRELLQDAEYDC